MLGNISATKPMNPPVIWSPRHRVVESASRWTSTRAMGGTPTTSRRSAGYRAGGWHWPAFNIADVSDRLYFLAAAFH
jgi:hypothetical protein